MKKIYLFSLLIMGLLAESQAQIVNIERSRMSEDTMGIQGNIDFSYMQRKNANKLILFNNSVAIQYRTGNNIFLGLNNFGFIDIVGSDAFPDQSFYQHLRYTRILDSANTFALEALGQTQSDRLLKIGIRVLAGAGGRWMVLDREKIDIKTGLIGMFEYEEEKDLDTSYQDIRASYYISYKLQPWDFVSWSATAYYQPVVDDFDDFRVSIVSSLDFKVKEWLSLGLGINWNYDASPSVQLTEMRGGQQKPLNIIYQTTNKLTVTF